MNSNTLTVIGQGYVGLPLAQAASAAGWKVFGLDKSDAVVEGLLAGKSHIDDLDDEEIGSMLKRSYLPTTDVGVIAQSKVVVICVPTPLNADGLPNLDYVEDASHSVGNNLQNGQIVILESTTYPGTTERLVIPIIEQASGRRSGADFYVAFSPERVDPGRIDFGLHNTPKLVGGSGVEATRLAIEFYSTFVEKVVPMRGPKEAETAKLLENTFRHVNIALVNEMAKFCRQLDIDIWDVINGAATKPFGFMKFTPGPGVGGHCIPIDPNYLSHEVRRSLGYPFRFVELAQEINNSMPIYVVDRVQDMLNDVQRSLKGSNVLLLGVTYKPNISDQRESPAVPVARQLMAKGANVQFHDPFVEVWKFGSTEMVREGDLHGAVAAADAVVLLQQHADYDAGWVARAAKTFLDTRGTAPEMEHRL